MKKEAALLMETASEDAVQLFHSPKEGEVNKVKSQSGKPKLKQIQNNYPRGPQSKCRRCLGTHY